MPKKNKLMYEDTKQFKDWIADEIQRQKESIALGDKCDKYYEGDQLPEDVKIIIEDREQPEQWENNLIKVGNKIQGYMINRNAEVKVYGKRRADKQRAIIVQEIMRNIADHSDYRAEKIDSDLELQNRGIAIQEVFVKTRNETDEMGNYIKDVFIKNIPAGECIVDSYANEKDYSDAQYFHRLFYVQKEDLYMFFDDDIVDTIRVDGNWSNESRYDREYESNTRDEVLVVETWYRRYNRKEKRNEYFFCFWVDDTILLQDESPYEFEGFPFAVSYVMRNKKTGAYHGLFKDILPIQDSINFAKIRLHNMLGSVKLLIGNKAVEDIDEFRDEWANDDAAVEVKDVNRIREINQNSKIMQLLSIIKDGREQIKELMGVNDEFLAMANNRLSGEAIGKRLEIGITGLSNYINASENLQKRSMKLAVKMITQFYDANRQIQIVGEENIMEYNIPVRDNYGVAQYVIKDGWRIPIVENNLRDGSYTLTYTTQMQPLTSARERYALNIELLKIIKNFDEEAAYELLPEVLKDNDAPNSMRMAKILEDKIAQRKELVSNQGQASQEELANLQQEIEIAQAKVKRLNAESELFLAKADKSKVESQLTFKELMAG